MLFILNLQPAFDIYGGKVTWNTVVQSCRSVVSHKKEKSQISLISQLCILDINEFKWGANGNFLLSFLQDTSKNETNIIKIISINSAISQYY